MLSLVAFPSNWRWTYIMNSEQTVPPPNCMAHFTIEGLSLGRIVTVFNGIYFLIIERK